MATSDIKKGPLCVDSTNNRVGIGLTDPEQLLHLKNASGNCVAVLGQYGTGTKATITAASNQVELKADSGTNDIMTFKTGSSERLRIDSSGNVGIGVSPTDILHIKDSASTNVIIDAPTDNASLTLQCGSADSGAEGAFVQFIQNTTSKWQMGMNTDNSFRWYNYNLGSEAMQLDTSGNLLIGTTNSQYNGIGAPAAITSFNNGSRFGANFGASTTGAQYAVVFSNPNGQIGGVYVNGSATSYITSSDYRLKTAVEYDWDATSRLKQLKPARFKWIADGDDAVFVDGFLAHECGAVPESITGEKDAMKDEQYVVSAATGDIYTPATDDADEVIHRADAEKPEELAEGQQWRETTAAEMGTRSVPDYQGIDQAKLVPLLCKTILELEARITALEAG